MKTLQALYYQRMNEARKQPLSHARKQTFVRGVANAFLRSVFLPGGHLTREMRSAISNLHDKGVFTLCLKGMDEITDCDLFFANHQGPKQLGGPQGGIEVLLGTQFVKDSTRYVVRRNLVDYSWSIIQCIKAHAMRKQNPITVMANDRLSRLRARKASWSEIKEAAIGLKQERQRVATEVFHSIDSGTPVIIYPEGTRSATGKILPFVSDFMRQTITDYIVPRTLSGNPRRIGLIVAETLQTFPNGVGRDAFLCDRPATMCGIRYDTGPIEAGYESIRHLEHKAYTTALTKLARTLALDLRETFEREVREILQ